jgi:hypothetical protein
MAESRRYTLNSSFGRAARFTFAPQKLACAEIELRQPCAGIVPSEEVC